MALSFASGELLTAAKLNRFVPIFKAKTGTQAVSASTTVVDDTDLFVDLAAGRTYQIDAFVSANGTAAGDIKVVWTNTGTMTFPQVRSCSGPSIATTSANATAAAATTVGVTVAATRTMTTEVPYGVDGAISSAIEESFIVVCTVAGRLQLRWAQNTASGTTNVTANSWIRAIPLD